MICDDDMLYLAGFSGGSRGSEPKRNGVKAPPDRRMENGVSSFLLLEICSPKYDVVVLQTVSGLKQVHVFVYCQKLYFIYYVGQIF